MEILGLNRGALADLIGRPLDSIALEKGTAELGGRSGSEVALIRARAADGDDFRVIVKYLPPRYAHEPEVHRLLYDAGAPLATPYGHIEHPDGARTLALEYLPVSVSWPIPPDYHYAWIDSLAALAALPLPPTLPLERVEWSALGDKLLADMAYAAAIDDAVLRDALRQRGLDDLVARCAGALPDLLDRADRLPVAFNHGEVYGQHTGRRRGEATVRVFDLGASRIGPRFMDLIAATIDHATPYEVPIAELTEHFYRGYAKAGGPPLTRGAFADEVALCRALVALTWFQHVGFVEEQLGTPADNGELWNNPRKWVVLHLAALRDYLDANYPQ